jgi:exonuclease III
MCIATWNVNSLKAHLEKVTWWLERARPDVLLMQETKLADAAAPVPRSAQPATIRLAMVRGNGMESRSLAASGSRIL